MTISDEDLVAGHTILRAVVGSTAAGTAIDGTSDRDELGVAVEPPSVMFGLDHFEQHTFRSAAGQGARSQAGDVEGTIYGLHKYVSLALKANPNVLGLLFTPDDMILEVTDLGRELMGLAPAFVSRAAAEPFLGYLKSQRSQLGGSVAAKVRRPELVERFGFDTKFAYHAVRLGAQGVELLTTGRIVQPILEPLRGDLIAIRQGKVSLADVFDRIDGLETELLRLQERADLPDGPDRNLVSRWLTEAYPRHWASVGATS